MDSRCARGYWLLRIDDFKKNIDTKTPSPPSPTNYTKGQSSQLVYGPSVSCTKKKTLDYIEIVMVTNRVAR